MATSTPPPPSLRVGLSWAVRLENYEPMAWAEELIDRARAVDHPRLAYLYVMASLRWSRDGSQMPSATAKQVRRRWRATETRSHSVWGACLAVLLAAGQPERYVEMARTYWAGGRETDTLARATYVMALTALGSLNDEAVAVATGLIDAAETVRNPSVLSLALLAYGYAFSEADPDRALATLFAAAW